MRRKTLFLSLLSTSGLIAPMLRAEIDVPGADGSDGNLIGYGTEYLIDLAQATNGAWNSPSVVPGWGVYDNDKWAVVYKYENVTIPAGTTVRFKNHPSGAPVVWLVSGDVTIDGTINLDSKPGSATDFSIAESGPGGWPGGGQELSTLSPEGAGRGPGGALFCGGYPSFSSTTQSPYCEPPPTYGHPSCIPLLGGSGGKGGNHGGDGGGGAILIACANTIRLGGKISAIGNIGNTASPWGTGGSIRLVAETIQDAPNEVGQLRTGTGRVRLEANSLTVSDPATPPYTFGVPGQTAQIWPYDSAPSVRIITLSNHTVPTDPRAKWVYPGTDVTLTSDGAQLVSLDARNVPFDWEMAIRVVPKQGPDFIYYAFPTSGTESQSIWQAVVYLPSGFAAIQARAFEAIGGGASAPDSDNGNGTQVGFPTD